MSSFFTVPASQRKRKRNDAEQAPKARGRTTTNGTEASKRRRRDESISGSSDSGESTRDQSDGESSETSSSGHEDETGAERRLRIAENYLRNVKKEVQQVHGFDAEEIDRDLIAERLKDDVAESKGALHRFIAHSYDYEHATQAHFRGETGTVTSVAACLPYVYTVSKDRRLTKWKLSSPLPPSARHVGSKPRPPPRLRPFKIVSRRGNHHRSVPNASDRPPQNRKGQHDQQQETQHHSSDILCVTASADGRFVATGGRDRRLIIWSAERLEPLRVFTQHRDSINALALQRGAGANRLFSASSDRTIKTWALEELAYVETLFGHQDQVVDVAALAQERCLSAGARDRSVRLWKVVDETQLVFRGEGPAGAAKGGARGESRGTAKETTNGTTNGTGTKGAPARGGGADDKRGGGRDRSHAEGSIERAAFIDDETFVTGSDNGALSLWSVHKKKAVFVQALAHGADPPPTLAESFAETDLTGRTPPAPPRARWITALRVLPFSDLMVSASWDGCVRVWRITPDRRRFEPVADVLAAPGVINDIALIERGDRGSDGICIVVALGKEHRLGRWQLAGPTGQNGAVVIEIPKLRFGEKKLVNGG